MSEIVAPYFELYIGGKKLTESWLELVNEVVYEDTSTGSDLLTITMSDPDLDILKSDRIFIEEQAVKFVGGYINNFRTLFEGYISVIDVDFPESGETSITVTCMDNTHLMNREEKTRAWQNQTISSVATEILMSYGFDAIVDDTVEVVETISQTDQTDADFLSSQAGDLVDKFLFFIEENVAQFVKKKILDVAQDTITYRDDGFKLISFSPRITKEQKKEQVKKEDVDSKTGSVDTGLATESIARDISGDSVQTSSDAVETNGGSADKVHVYQGDGVWS